MSKGWKNRDSQAAVEATRYENPIPSRLFIMEILEKNGADGLEEIKICVGYKNAEGESITTPVDAEEYEALEPIYETVPGWSESTFGVKSLDGLPANALSYIKRLEEVTGAPIDIVSTDPDRVETIVLRQPFEK